MIAKIKGVSKEYKLGDQTLIALQPTDLQLEEGELLLVIGPSGSGKTTLLLLLGCIIYQTAGELWVNKQQIKQLNQVELLQMFLCCSTVVRCQTFSIRLTIKNLHNNSGIICMVLFNSDDGYPSNPQKAFRQKSATIINYQSILEFENLPRATYAVACYHDENNNNLFDKNFFGKPLEGHGASNNAKSMFGPHKFSKAKFLLDKDVSQNILISY